MRIDPDRDALIVVDLQPDFMPGGPLAVAEGDVIAGPIGALAGRFRTVVATQDWHPRGHISFASSHPGTQPFQVIALPGGEQTLWPEHCVAGTEGARLHAALPDASVSLVLRKGSKGDADSYSAFRENPDAYRHRAPTGLAGWLRERGIRRLFVVGLARDFCVRATALDGVAAGFETWVIDDLTRAVAPQAQAPVDAAFREHGVHLIHSSGLVS
jgi:nicotinamidase/pyrazinamidase